MTVPIALPIAISTISAIAISILGPPRPPPELQEVDGHHGKDEEGSLGHGHRHHRLPASASFLFAARGGNPPRDPAPEPPRRPQQLVPRPSHPGAALRGAESRPAMASSGQPGAGPPVWLLLLPAVPGGGADAAGTDQGGPPPRVPWRWGRRHRAVK